MKFKNLVVLITGGASGIGECLARMLVKLEAKVIICDLQTDKGEQLEKEFGGKIKFYSCNIVNEIEVENMFNDITKIYGRLDVLVNNAGVGYPELTATEKTIHSTKAYDFVMDINTYGSFLISRYGAKLMIKNATDKDSLCNGSIIFVSSVAGIEGQKGQAVYGASKAALIGMTLPMARDLGKYKIRVNSICPGVIETPMTAPIIDNKNTISMIENTPIKRTGKPEEVADVALFCIENDFLNGSIIRIDGGIRFPHY